MVSTCFNPSETYESIGMITPNIKKNVPVTTNQHMVWDQLPSSSILQPGGKGEELVILHHLHHANLLVQGANMAHRLHYITGTWPFRVLPVGASKHGVWDVASIFFHWQFEHDLVLLPLSWLPSGYLTWPCKMDENGPFLDDFPKTSIYSGFSMAMLKNQMVTFTVNVFSWNRWNMAMSVETIQESTSYDSHLDRQW